MVAGHTQMAAQVMYCSVLLFIYALIYVLLSVFSFVLAVSVTLCCIRLRDRERGLRERKGKNTLPEKEDKRDGR